MDGLKEQYEKAMAALESISQFHDLFEGSYLEFMSDYDREVRSRFNQWYEEYYQPLHTSLTLAMREVVAELEEKMPDIEAYEMPKAEEVPLDGDCLYDSTREYFPQLAAYKQFAGKFSQLTEEEDEEEDDDE